VDEPLAQRILEIIYRDSSVNRPHKESLTDWILDTQPRTLPLDGAALVHYLAGHQPDILERLRINVHIKEEIERALENRRRK
jgi:hypothetical protein